MGKQTVTRINSKSFAMAAAEHYVMIYIARSLIFVIVYQVIAYIVCRVKARDIIANYTLMKLELAAYLLLNVWFLSFASIASDVSWFCLPTDKSKNNTSLR